MEESLIQFQFLELDSESFVDSVQLTVCLSTVSLLQYRRCLKGPVRLAPNFCEALVEQPVPAT